LIWGNGYGVVTIEALCELAQVNKGSFYYFFDSKSDLAISAIKSWWENRRATIDKHFRPEIPPLDRIVNYITFAAQSQIQEYEKTGLIVGAPLFRIGSEIATHNEPLRLYIAEAINCGIRYFEEAISEAQASGQAVGKDAALKARIIMSHYMGTLTLAHIENNPELVRNLASDVVNLINSQPLAVPSKPPNKSGTDFDSMASISSKTYPRVAENEVKKQEALADLVSMGEYADVMVVMADTHGCIEWGNDSFVRTCGYSLQELRGKKPGKLLQGPESDPVAIKTLHDAVHSAHPCACQIINYKKNGTPYPVFISILPLFENEIHSGFISVEQDLSPGRRTRPKLTQRGSAVIGA